MNQVWTRGITSFLILTLALLLLYPNFAPRKLAIVFYDAVRTETGELIPVDRSRIDKFLKDDQIGFLYHFPGQECRPEGTEKIPAERRCVVSKRFLTTAEVNEIIQSYPVVVDDAITGMENHQVEKYY